MKMLTKNINSDHLKITILIVGLALFFNLIYKPLPDDFKQPWKYRLICFGAEFITVYGKVLEYLDFGHRLNVTRFAYHWTLGAFNIRNPNDEIKIIDDSIENIPIRIYRPNQISLSEHHHPTILLLHGGGHFLGSADIIEPVSYLLAKNTNFQVIYIEFRLIPEHKYPAALVDSLKVTKYIVQNNVKYAVDLNNLVLLGDSAGGNLAAVISQHLIEHKIAVPKLQVLIYPILQFFDFTLPSYRTNMPKRILGNIGYENFKNFIHYLTDIEVDDTIFSNGHTTRIQKESILSEYVNHGYLPSELRKNHDLESISMKNDSTNKYEKLTSILLDKNLSPLLVDDVYLANNTPMNTILVTTELDILRDDGFIYAERLRKLGKFNIRHKHYSNYFHGILGLLHGPLIFYESHNLLNDIVNEIKLIL